MHINFNLPGYHIIRRDRTSGKRGGGICICVKQSVNFSELRIPNPRNEMELMAIKVNDIVIVNVYNPPSNSIDINVLSYFKRFSNILLCGDFNARHRMWDVGSPNNNGYRLVEFIEENDFTVLNITQSTHMVFNTSLNTSLIVLTISSPNIAHKCCVVVTNNFMGSDHCVIDVKINASADMSGWSPSWAFNRADWTTFSQLCNIEINSSLISPNVRECYTNICSTIMSIASRTIPLTEPCRKVPVPWWNQSCKIALRNKKHAFNRMLRTRDPQDIIIFKRLRAKAKKILNKAKQDCWQNYCSSISSNVNLGQVWSTIKKFNRQQTTARIPPLHQNGIVGTNDQHKANMLANQFQKVSSNNNYSSEFRQLSQSISLNLHNKLSCHRYHRTKFNDPFTIDELNAALKKSKNSSLGPDRLSCEMLKHMPRQCLHIILFLFNKIWFTGDIPSSWLHSTIVPVHKPNKQTNLPSSYRPISLTSHMCKLMERMVTVRLRWYLEKNTLIQEQSGFRERRRPTDHLLRLHDTVHKALQTNDLCWLCFLILRKRTIWCIVMF